MHVSAVFIKRPIATSLFMLGIAGMGILDVSSPNRLEAERKHGKTAAEAIYEGCLIRFRPIMMTTLAALLGAVPVAIGFGAGG